MNPLSQHTMQKHAFISSSQHRKNLSVVALGWNADICTHACFFFSTRIQYHLHVNTLMKSRGSDFAGIKKIMVKSV